MIAVSLDCTGAFDCVGFDAASDTLINKGVPRGITLWYTNLLKGRKVTANLQGVTPSKEEMYRSCNCRIFKRQACPLARDRKTSFYKSCL